MSTRSDWLLAADYAEHVLPHLQVLYPGEGRLMPVVQALVIARGMADGSNAADQARLGYRDIYDCRAGGSHLAWMPDALTARKPFPDLVARHAFDAARAATMIHAESWSEVELAGIREHEWQAERRRYHMGLVA